MPKATQPPRVRPNFGPQERASHHEKALTLSNDIREACESIQKHIDAIAERNSRSKEWVLQQLSIVAPVKKRGPNAWNGFIKGKLEAANKDRAPGDRISVHQLLDDPGIRAEWEALPGEAKDVLKAEIETAQGEKQTVVQADPRGASTDVQRTFKHMQSEWTSVEHHTGGEGFYVFVRKGLGQYYAPQMHYSPGVEKFLKNAFDIEPEEFALRLESFLVGGGVRSKPIASRPVTSLISKCRALIQEGLNHIVQQECIGDKLNMNYDNYELRIVEEHGIALVGWPDNVVRNPGKLGNRAAVETLYTALKDCVCRWVKLTADELEAHICQNTERVARGESIYKLRKRSATKAKKTLDIILDDEEEPVTNLGDVVDRSGSASGQ